MDYIVGDVQGCCDALDRLLEQIAFSPSRDHVVVLGDLVNRGPRNLATLERLRGLGASATCLLGNHDLHLLAVAKGVRAAHRGDTLGEILASREREGWLDWLRRCIGSASLTTKGRVTDRRPPATSAGRTSGGSRSAASLHWTLSGPPPGRHRSG